MLTMEQLGSAFGDGHADPAMTRTVRWARAGVALAARRPRRSLLLVLLGMLLALVTVAAATVHESAREAVAESAAAHLGGRGFVVATGDAEVRRGLAGLAGVSPIMDTSGRITSAAGSIDAAIRVTDDPSLVLGTLVDGEPARRAGEVLVTRSLARPLRVSVGDTVTLTQRDGPPQRVRVAGVVVDTARAGARSVELVGRPGAADAADRWVSDRDPADRPEMNGHLVAGRANLATRGMVVGAALENALLATSALTYVPYAALALVLGGLGASFRRAWARDVAALDAAGVAPERVWTVTMLLLAGALLGSGLAVGGVAAARSVVSEALGQDWVHVSPPLVTLAWLVVTVLALGAVTVPTARRLGSVGAEAPGPRERLTRTRIAKGLVAAVLLGGLVTVLSRWGGGPGASRVPAFGAGVLLVVVAALLCGPSPSGVPRGARRLLDRVSAFLAAVFVVAVMLALAVSTWSAMEFMNVSVAELTSDETTQPPGSLVVIATPMSALPRLADRYAELGGGPVTSYESIRDVDGQWFATSPAGIRCIQQHRGAEDLIAVCPDTVGGVALGDPDAPTTAPAHLVERGEVGLVAQASGRPVATAVVPADVGPDRAFPLPELVLRRDDPVVQRLGIRGGGSATVVLHRFGELPVAERLALRSFALTLSPTSWLSDATLPDGYERIRATTTGVALAGAAMALLSVLTAGGVLALAGTRLRRVVLDVGFAAARRVGIAVCGVAASVTVLLLAPLVLTATTVYGAFTAFHDLGLAWLIAYLAGLSMAFAIGTAYQPLPSVAARVGVAGRRRSSRDGEPAASE